MGQLGEKSPKKAKKISPRRRCLRRRTGNIEKIKGNSRKILVLSSNRKAWPRSQVFNPPAADYLGYL
jgi:hypothetical protein